MIRILSLTTLFPYPARPRHGIFVENRLKALKAGGHEIRVIAPVPWFPSGNKLFRDWAKYANPPSEEVRHGIPISHPRYLIVPKMGMRLAVNSLEKSFERGLQAEIQAGRRPNLLDAHYLYPDGVAATRVAKKYGIPVVLTARGSDVTQLPDYSAPRRMIMQAVADSDHVITVADALKDKLISLGADPTYITTVRNGVDLEVFTPSSQKPSDFPDHDGPIILSVGHLIARKGHELIIRALKSIPSAHLLIIGDGVEKSNLKRLCAELDLSARVSFLGERAHTDLPGYYAHADLFALGSKREGWPNVLLEAMACGTPCVSTPAGGAAEVITSPEAGLVIKERTVSEMQNAIELILANLPSREKTRSYAEQYSWEEVSDSVQKIWSQAEKKQSSAGWGQIIRSRKKENDTLLILTIDAEEVFDWNGYYSKWSLPDISALRRLQNIAEKNSIKPLYFVSYSLLNDQNISSLLATWVHEGKAACGLHLHSWITPPIRDKFSYAQTFQSNLDTELHQEKLLNLIESYVSVFGTSPIAHRAGRYGVAPWIFDQLADQGIMLDFSPSAGFDFRDRHGPDFSWMTSDTRKRNTNAGPQWVMPVSGAFMLRKCGLAFNRSTLSPYGNHFISSLGSAVRLTPEGNSLSVMKDLTRHLTARKVRVLTPTLHLTSLIPGATPYAQSTEDVDRLADLLDQYLGWVTASNLRPVSLAELHEKLSDQT